MTVAEVALCGAGLIAGVHALAARRSGLVIGEVASRTRARADKRAAEWGARAVDPDGLTAELEIVCTPPSDHAASARRALDRGAHVLVEKPLTTTLADADRLAAHPRRDALHYGENLLHSPIFDDYLARLRTLGPLTHLELRTLQSAPTWGGFLDPAWGGGVLFDLGIHPLALAVIVGRVTGNGEVVTVRTHLDGETTDVHAVVALEFASGLMARLEAAWDGPESGVWDVQASSRTAVARLELRPAIAIEVNGEPVTDTAAGGTAAGDLGFVDDFGYTAQIAALADSRRTDSSAGVGVDLAHWLMEIVCACYLSAGRDGALTPVPSGCDRERTPWQLWRGE